MALHRTPAVRSANAAPHQKITADSGQSTGRTLIGVLVIGGAICLGFMVLVGKGEPKVEAHETIESDERYTADALTRGLVVSANKPAATPAKAEEPKVEKEKTEEVAPEVESVVVMPAEVPALSLEQIRARSAGSMVAVRIDPVMTEGSFGDDEAFMRNVPRGAIFDGVLESAVVSDNLDSRVRVRLDRDYRFGETVIFPKEGYFVGDVFRVDSRYQKRIAVRITHYVYPDWVAAELGTTPEVEFSGLLLNPDESAHLVASDIRHHTGKLIAGVTALEGLRAVAGAIGGGSRTNVAVNFGQGVGSGLQDIYEPRIETILEIPPTLSVEPGKPVYVFVDKSFEVPSFEDVLRGHRAPKPPPEPSEATTPTMPQIDPAMLAMMQAQAEALQRMSAGPGGAPAYPPMGPPGMMAPGLGGQFGR